MPLSLSVRWSRRISAPVLLALVGVICFSFSPQAVSQAPTDEQRPDIEEPHLVCGYLIMGDIVGDWEERVWMALAVWSDGRMMGLRAHGSEYWTGVAETTHVEQLRKAMDHLENVWPVEHSLLPPCGSHVNFITGAPGDDSTKDYRWTLHEDYLPEHSKVDLPLAVMKVQALVIKMIPDLERPINDDAEMRQRVDKQFPWCLPD